MYNRYTPQPDGSFSRSRVQEKIQTPEGAVVNNSKTLPVEVSSAPETAETPKGPPVSHPNPPNIKRGNNQFNRNSRPEPFNNSVGGFLKGLLPQNFDTEDLIVVLLLLLMSGNSGNDQNAALLTLGIYLFM